MDGKAIGRKEMFAFFEPFLFSYLPKTVHGLVSSSSGFIVGAGHCCEWSEAVQRVKAAATELTSSNTETQKRGDSRSEVKKSYQEDE